MQLEEQSLINGAVLCARDAQLAKSLRAHRLQLEVACCTPQRQCSAGWPRAGGLHAPRCFLAQRPLAGLLPDGLQLGFGWIYGYDSIQCSPQTGCSRCAQKGPPTSKAFIVLCISGWISAAVPHVRRVIRHVHSSPRGWQMSSVVIAPRIFLLRSVGGCFIAPPSRELARALVRTRQNTPSIRGDLAGRRSPITTPNMELRTFHCQPRAGVRSSPLARNAPPHFSTSTPPQEYRLGSWLPQPTV
ncbi:hypothetical protein CPSG_05109 [Coccidioides posadasii str. Silveira]|uniref:Uncharacterized protein n=1 Tax=Coccidioides posadasii (strain RMSCC 757 / Silveira) TaxID=443226 RepID=E9D679_COCPS|nr:hypothetical protein CPSG_05109 [Coccidioides posadasii str. Silveira]